MSCVAEAKAVITNRIKVKVNSEIGVEPAAIVALSGCGMLKVVSTKTAVMSNCIHRIHHRLVFKISTNGLHNGLIVHGR